MNVHFTGACGRATGALALDLQRRPGWKITASDAVQYAPMNAFLLDHGLVIAGSYSARNIPADTQVVVRGFSVESGNVELKAARRRGLPVLNLAQFIEAHLLKKGRRIVVAGTNGKTTTTAMLAWILKHAGRCPSYLIGGLCSHFDSPAHFRNRPWTVLEGDEYPAGKDDPKPKFLYYHPDILVITNLAYDHTEVYANLEEIRHHFATLVEGVPGHGRIIIPDDCANSLSVIPGSRAAVERVGTSKEAEVRILGIRVAQRGMNFQLDGQSFTIPLFGRMNVTNAVLAARAALAAGVSLEQSAAALAEFCGVAGRMEDVVDQSLGALIIDEGYHPAALRENIAAIRQRFPCRRLVVALQPRYTGGREGFQMTELPEVLAKADRVILMGSFDLVEFAGGPFRNSLLAARLRRKGTPVHVLRSTRGLPNFIGRVWEPGDVLLCSLIPGSDFIVLPLAEKIRGLASP